MDAITFAIKEYSSRKVRFIRERIENYSKKHNVVVSLETIEHLHDLESFRQMLHRVNPEIAILSFPNKRSTHFNQYHKHDLNSQQIVELLDRFILVKQVYQHDIQL